MSEAEIKAIVETSKIGKATKENLLQIGRKNDIKYQLLQSEISNLKKDYEKKIKELEMRIVKTQKNHEEVQKKQITENSLEEKISMLHESLMEFKREFSSKFDSFEKRFSLYAESSNITKQPDYISNIDSKLSLVTEKINAETERKLKDRKALNVVVFNIPEATNASTSLESCKKDLQVLQEVLGESKIKKHELKTLHRIGRIEEGRIRPIVVKLNDKNTKQRLLKLRNLKCIQDGTQSNVYINPDRTVEELKIFKKLREEMKSKQVIAEKNNWNVKYVIRNNKVIESTNQPFRYDAQKLWD